MRTPTNQDSFSLLKVSGIARFHYIERITNTYNQKRCANDGEHTENKKTVSRVQTIILTSSCQLLFGIPLITLIISKKRHCQLTSLLVWCGSLATLQNLSSHYVVGHQIVEPCTCKEYIYLQFIATSYHYPSITP